MSFPFWNYSYPIVIVLQIICILHALRTGRRDWIYLLIFLPFVGAVVYIIREVLPGLRSTGVDENIRRGLFPNGRIKELERALRLANTDSNRLKLAAEYARQHNFEKAIELTKACLTGIYANNAGMMLDLARYTFGAQHYAESIMWFDRVLAQKDRRIEMPEDQLLYARALQLSGRLEEAEAAFKTHIRTHHSMEAMYYYGLMLKDAGRKEEARAQFKAVREERELHPAHVRRRNARFISASRRELAGLK